MSRRSCLILFALVLVATWYCYSASLGAEFQLDDQTNLGGLANVVDRQSAIDFVFSGDAGPTGRPLALATFVVQADEWQAGADAFLRINILIHLCNALLLAIASRTIMRLAGYSRQNSLLVACAAASLWVVMPLLATSTLLVVQRMTTLSALFMLLGVVGYVYLRSVIASRPMTVLAGMTGVLVVATVLGALSKESALLLPGLILVLETTLLGRPAGLTQQIWRNWRLIILGIPLVAILVYLASRSAYPDYMIARRDFTAFERLLTEAQVLWLYLSKALVGIPGRLGIYHEDVRIVRSLLEPLALLSVLAWLGIIGVAFAWRRRHPLFSFAVLWFIVGHLVESTVVPLELYFEHRNYVPMIGPVLAVCAFLIVHSNLTRRIAVVALPLALIVNLSWLFTFASLQAESSLAARYWVEKHPNSVRAAANLITRQFAEEGVPAALQTLTTFVAKNPQHAYLYIQELNVRCQIDANAADVGRADAVAEALRNVDFSYTAAQMLSQLATSVFRTQCVAVPPAKLVKLAESLRSNPRYVNDVMYQGMHSTLMASISRQMGDLTDTREHLSNALRLDATPERVMMMTMTLVESGKLAEAQQFLEEMSHDQPRHPLKAVRWKRNIADLERYVSAVASQE